MEGEIFFKRYFIYYNPNFYPCYVELLEFKEIIFKTSGVVNSLCTSYVEAMSASELRYHFANNKGNITIDKTVFDEQISPKLNQISVNEFNDNVVILPTLNNGTNCHKWVSDKYDELPSLLAEKMDGIVFCSDYYEAAYARYNNIPFVFLIQNKKQIEIFWGKIQRLCINIGIIKSKEDENI